MPTIVRSPDAHLEPVHSRYASRTPAIGTLVAGEAIPGAAVPCYIKSSDGKVYMASGSAANEASELLGFSAKAYALNEPVTLFREGAVFYYSDGLLTAGNFLYMHPTFGLLNGSAQTGDAKGVAVALDSKHILVTRASNNN